jgi:hypothetical protein
MRRAARWVMEDGGARNSTLGTGGPHEELCARVTLGDVVGWAEIGYWVYFRWPWWAIKIKRLFSLTHYFLWPALNVKNKLIFGTLSDAAENWSGSVRCPIPVVLDVEMSS